MKVIRRGSLSYDGQRLKLRGWQVRFGKGEDYPGDASDFSTERGVRTLTAILIRIAAQYGIVLEEVEHDHALCEPLYAEKVMRETLERARVRTVTTWRERCAERVRRAGRFLSIMVWGC